MTHFVAHPLTLPLTYPLTHHITHTLSLPCSINRCLDFTKANSGIALVPHMESVELREALQVTPLCPIPTYKPHAPCYIIPLGLAGDPPVFYTCV